MPGGTNSPSHADVAPPTVGRMKIQAFARARLALATSALAALALAGCSDGDQAADAPRPESSEPAGSTSSRLPREPDADYADGTYEARGTYGGGPSFLDVTVTIDDDVITDVEVGTPATDETSLEYQQAFAAAVPDEVIGRDLGEVSVGKLAGSSSCGDGFNDAIAQIRDQARA
jgi:uncharacterized protein with FMN-binding domain